MVPLEKIAGTCPPADVAALRLKELAAPALPQIGCSVVASSTLRVPCAMPVASSVENRQAKTVPLPEQPCLPSEPSELLLVTASTDVTSGWSMTPVASGVQ